VNFAILGSRGFPSTYGGYETLVRNLAPYLVHRGHSVTVYCRVPSLGRRRWVTEDVRCIATAGFDTKSLSTLSFGLTASVDAAVRRYDAVLVLNVANGFFVPLLRTRGVPCAVNTDGLEWERGKWSTLGKSTFRSGARLAARQATTVVSDSQAMQKIWQRLFGCDSVFIPYGSHIMRNPGAGRLRDANLPTSGYLLAVARLAPENNIGLTLDALDWLGPDAPPAIFVGSANYESPIEDRLRRMQAEGRIRWLGHVEDQELLNELRANCSVYVHGHSVGGTNPSLLEALGAGAPVLALDTVFNREVLAADDQLFDGHPASLAERIRALAVDGERQRELTERGVRIIAERYGWDMACESYERLLTQLATGSGSAGAASLEQASWDPRDHRVVGERGGHDGAGRHDAVAPEDDPIKDH